MLTEDTNRVVSLEEAARRIYSTGSPTREQLSKVAEKIKSGRLRGEARGRYTTTLAAIADYLAVKETASRNPSGAVAAQGMRSLYRDVTREYFSAILLRSSSKGKSAAFRAAVIVGQMVLLIAASAFVTANLIVINRYIKPSPERVAIDRWLAEKYSRVEIEKVDAVSSEPKRIRTAFSYSGNNRRITGSLVFTFEGPAIVSVDSSADAGGD